MLYKSWLYSKYKKPKKTKKKRLSRLDKYALKLNQSLPVSKKWFQSLLERDGLINYFKYNSPIGSYIADAINRHYKVIIEIDGSFHNRSEEQKFKNSIKDKYLVKRGYKVFRIPAYNNEIYLAVINEFKKYLNAPHI